MAAVLASVQASSLTREPVPAFWSGDDILAAVASTIGLGPKSIKMSSPQAVAPPKSPQESAAAIAEARARIEMGNSRSHGLTQNKAQLADDPAFDAPPPPAKNALSEAEVARMAIMRGETTSKLLQRMQTAGEYTYTEEDRRSVLRDGSPVPVAVSARESAKQALDLARSVGRLVAEFDRKGGADGGTEDDEIIYDMMLDLHDKAVDSAEHMASMAERCVELGEAALMWRERALMMGWHDGIDEPDEPDQGSMPARAAPTAAEALVDPDLPTIDNGPEMAVYDVEVERLTRVASPMLPPTTPERTENMTPPNVPDWRPALDELKHEVSLICRHFEQAGAPPGFKSACEGSNLGARTELPP